MFECECGSMMTPRWFAGLMTGTVLDGRIDIAFLRTDGHRIDAFGPSGLVPYEDAVRDSLERALTAAKTWNFEGSEPPVFAEAERLLTIAQADAMIRFAASHDMPLTEIAAIGFHGQTVLHRPPRSGRPGRTRQLGDGRMMADHTGRPVVFDLRAADVAAGGQGAPLCPCYHAALLALADADEHVAVVNLGGIGNITWRAPDGRLLAFDTGPANAPINDWVRQHGLGEMDLDGHLARSGHIDERRLAELLRHPYFSAPFPKSLDRFDFPASLAQGMSAADGSAFLTALAAGAVARGVAMLPGEIKQLVICGGGRRNPAMMRFIAQRSGVPAVTAESVGWRGDAIEAECFAFLAARCLAGLDVSYPGTTGVPAPMPAGRLAKPGRPARLAPSGDR